jgi:alkaline phosphatase D
MLPEFPKLILDRFAVAHFWDDHDFGTNNSDKNYPDKVMSLEVLKDYFPVYPVTAHGDWQRFSYGDADFFLLDSRSQRDPSADADDANKSMLDGDELGAGGQYAWLTNGLRDSTARWKFILTPVPFNPTVPKPEAWMSYRTERQKIIDFVRANNVEGVIMLSGDLHAGGIDDGTNADFPEMLVPSVNTKGCLTAPSPGTWSEGVYAGPRDEVCGGYGVITVETEPPRVVLEIKKDTGETAVEYSVNGDQ